MDLLPLQLPPSRARSQRVSGFAHLFPRSLSCSRAGRLLVARGKHSGKLFAPSDFKNEDNYVKMADVRCRVARPLQQRKGTALRRKLSCTKSWRPHARRFLHRGRVMAGEATFFGLMIVPTTTPTNARVVRDDRTPFHAALSTNEAFERLWQNKFGAILTWVVARGPVRGLCTAGPDAKRRRPNATLLLRRVERAPEHKA